MAIAIIIADMPSSRSSPRFMSPMFSANSPVACSSLSSGHRSFPYLNVLSSHTLLGHSSLSLTTIPFGQSFLIFQNGISLYFSSPVVLKCALIVADVPNSSLVPHEPSAGSRVVVALIS